MATSTSYALVWHQINSQKFWKMYNCKKKEELFTNSCLGSAKTFNPVFPSSDAAATGQTWCGRTLEKKVTTSRKFHKNISIYARRSVGGERRRLSEFISHLLTHFKDKGSNTLKAQLDCIYCFNR